MKRSVIVSLTLVCAVLSGGGGTLAAGQQATPLTPPNEPGKSTQARVYIINRDRADAVPVTLQGIAPTDPLRVTISGVPAVTLSASTAIDTRGLRQAWEYRQIMAAAGEDPTALLNSAGADGWETTGVALVLPNGNTRIILKRPR